MAAAKKQHPNGINQLIFYGIPEDRIKYEVNDQGQIVKLTIMWGTKLSTNVSVLLRELFVKLEILEINSCSLSDMTNISNMLNLKNLKLKNNNLTNLGGLEDLQALEDLYIENNPINDISPIQSLRKLKQLSLEEIPLTRLNPLLNLRGLESLTINSLSGLVDIAIIGNLYNLKALHIFRINVPNIDFVNKLRKLEGLSISDANINSIAPIANLVDLTNLFLDGNNISDIAPLHKLTKLEYLSLTENEISNIYPLSGLKDLSDLYLDYNKIQDISPLAGLSKIKLLTLNNNILSDISPILHLSDKTNVTIRDNPVASSIPEEVLETGWAAIRSRFLSIQQEQLVKIPEAKMLFLGNTNVGKSDLLHYLESGNSPDDHLSTHGLVYKPLDGLLPDCRIHCWDFGGQEYFHATHQLFFSPGALHLLLWSDKDEQRDASAPESAFEIEYWLRCIEQLSMSEDAAIKEGESGVNDDDVKKTEKKNNIETILIENKIDLNNYAARLLEQKQYEDQFRNLQMHFTAISIKQKRRLEGLKELMKERLETLFNEHPPKYKEFQQKIHASKTPVMAVSDFGHTDDNYVRTAMEVLHKIGCILYFREIIPNKVFVKPVALLDLLYKKILDEKKQSSMTKKEIEKAIKDNALGLSFDEIIKLLRYFNLVFTISADKDAYYIPQYLPAAPPWIDFFERHQFKKVYMRITSDNYLMHQAMLQLFSTYAEYLKRGQEQHSYLFWKDGLVIEKDGHLLLVKFNREQQCIDLYTDVLNNNFELQQEVINYVLTLPEDKKGKKVSSKHIAGETSTKEAFLKEDRSARMNPWQSSFFNVMLSVDGKYFVSWKKLVDNRKKDIYHIEGINAEGKNKTFSVFDFNKYLPDRDKGKMKKIFISYSKQDLALVDIFIKHLEALKLDGKVSTWYCTELYAGSVWNAEIQEHFDAADIVCFMISPNFMSTKYIHEHEIARAFERKQKDENFLIVPIILDFCRWKTENNDLTQFTALPYIAKPIVDFKIQNMAWYIIEGVFAYSDRKEPATNRR